MIESKQTWKQNKIMGSLPATAPCPDLDCEKERRSETQARTAYRRERTNLELGVLVAAASLVCAAICFLVSVAWAWWQNRP